MGDLDTKLPRGALCTADPGVVSDALGGADRWHGSDAQIDRDPDTYAVSRWRTHGRGPSAMPTDPNKGNGLIGNVGAQIGQQCRAGMHCAVVAPDAVPETTTATATAIVAMRFHTLPAQDARTLFAPNSSGAGTSVVLSQTLGALMAKDDRLHVRVDLPCRDADGPRMAIVTVQAFPLD